MIPSLAPVHDERRQQRRAELAARLNPRLQAVLAHARDRSLAHTQFAQQQEERRAQDKQKLADAGPAAAGLAAAAFTGLAPPEDAEGTRSKARRAATVLGAAAATAAAARAAVAGVPPPDPEPGSGLSRDYMVNVLEKGTKFAFVDHVHMNWANILANEVADVNRSPFTVNGQPAWPGSTGPKVAVVGGGMSGLLTAWELSKLGMRVALYEGTTAPTDNLATTNGAGRVRATLLDKNDPATRVELGAMRFPSTAYLFWHYVSLLQVQDPNLPLVDFPNPMKMPSLYAHTDGSVWGAWQKGPLNLPPAAKAVADKHLGVFLSYVPPVPPDAINLDARGKSALDIARLVGDQSVLTAAQVKMIRAWWNWAARDIHTRSYETFIRASLTPEEVEIAGNVGFGTGGFKTLFPSSALDFMRLVLWDYSNEFALPTLYRLPYQMMNKAKAAGAAFSHATSVDGIYYLPSTGRYAVAHCPADGGSLSVRSDFDFIVCAMSHKAALELLNKSKGNKATVRSKLGGIDAIVPYVDTALPAYRSQQVPDLGNQGVASVKIFSTLTGPARNTAYARVKPAAATPYNKQVGVLFGAGRVGVTYHFAKDGEVLGNAPSAIGLNYSWNSDANALYETLLRPNAFVGPVLEARGIFRGADYNGAFASTVANAVAEQRGGAADPATVDSNWVNAKTSFADAWRRGSSNPSQWAIVFWHKVPHVRMAFKIDFPNFGKWSVYGFQAGATSYIAYRNGAAEFQNWDYESGDVQDPSSYPFTRKSRVTAGVFFCGCSFSHYGGWVEGAFQSGLSNAQAVYYAAVAGTGADVATGGPVTGTASWKGLFGDLEATRVLWTQYARER